MNGFTGALFIGIVAGLTTTLIVVAISWVWRNAIVPWYEERIYKDAKIEGKWFVEYTDLENKEVVNLNRNGHNVSGVISVTEGPDKGKAYEFEGLFKNLLLTISYAAVDQSHLDRGTFTMRLKNNGKNLEGASAYYEDPTDTVTTSECKWLREEPKAKKG